MTYIGQEPGLGPVGTFGPECHLPGNFSGYLKFFCFFRHLQLQGFPLSFLHPRSIYKNQNNEANEGHQQFKPGGFPDIRHYHQFDGYTGFIPDIITIGTFDPEHVISGGQVGVIHCAGGAAIYPIFIKIFQHIGILVLLGIDIVQRCKPERNGFIF